MVWRELILVRNGQVAVAQHSHPFVPDLHKLKHITLKGTKKFGYIVLFVILRFFIRSSNFIKTISKILIKELKNKFKKIVHDSKEEITEKKEASKYLKIISEYQHKIRQMKHRIKEEEGIE
jgi:hypothetical protein